MWLRVIARAAHLRSLRDLTTRAHIYHDWLRAGEFLLTPYRTIFPRQKLFYKPDFFDAFIPPEL